jgi:hypothetical protein
MAESVYVPSTLKEGYFADLPAPVAGDDARPITYNHATLSFVYSNAFATAAQLTTHANLTNGAHGLVIGTNVQAYNANLAAWAGLTGAADKLGYFTGVGALALTDFTTVGRNVVAATTQALARTALGLGTIATAASGDYAAMAAANTFPLLQTMTLGAKLPSVQPLADGATAWRLFKANGSTAVITADTSAATSVVNVAGKVGINLSVLGSLCLDVFTNAAGTPVLVQSNGAASGNTLIRALNGGTVTGTLYGFAASIASTDEAIFSCQQNSSGNATFEMRVLGAGDARSLYAINGGQAWSTGLDNSDGDKYKISSSGTLGTDDRLIIDPTGLIGIGALSAEKLNVVGTIQADGLRLDVTPTAETPSMTHTIMISVDGTNYKLPCVAA